MKRVEALVEESEARLAESPEAQGIYATIVLMQVEGPKPKAVARRRSGEGEAGHRDATDAPELELDDALPPGA